MTDCSSEGRYSVSDGLTLGGIEEEAF